MNLWDFHSISTLERKGKERKEKKNKKESKTRKKEMSTNGARRSEMVGCQPELPRVSFFILLPSLYLW